MIGRRPPHGDAGARFSHNHADIHHNFCTPTGQRPCSTVTLGGGSYPKPIMGSFNENLSIVYLLCFVIYNAVNSYPLNTPPPAKPVAISRMVLRNPHI